MRTFLRRVVPAAITLLVARTASAVPVMVLMLQDDTARILREEGPASSTAGPRASRRSSSTR